MEARAAPEALHKQPCPTLNRTWINRPALATDILHCTPSVVGVDIQATELPSKYCDSRVRILQADARDLTAAELWTLQPKVLILAANSGPEILRGPGIQRGELLQPTFNPNTNLHLPASGFPHGDIRHVSRNFWEPCSRRPAVVGSAEVGAPHCRWRPQSGNVRSVPVLCLGISTLCTSDGAPSLGTRDCCR